MTHYHSASLACCPFIRLLLPCLSLARLLPSLPSPPQLRLPCPPACLAYAVFFASLLCLLILPLMLSSRFICCLLLLLMRESVFECTCRLQFFTLYVFFPPLMRADAALAAMSAWSVALLMPLRYFIILRASRLKSPLSSRHCRSSSFDMALLYAVTIRRIFFFFFAPAFSYGGGSMRYAQASESDASASRRAAAQRVTRDSRGASRWISVARRYVIRVASRLLMPCARFYGPLVLKMLRVVDAR